MSSAPIASFDAPDDLVAAFWEYERALVSDDVAAMDELFSAGPTTLRGDSGGLLVGHDEISAFRRSRGGAPARDVTAVHVRVVTQDAALVVAVTAPTRGGRGLQTQLWLRQHGRWQVAAAHVSPPPPTFDTTVWRVVGDPLIAGAGAGQSAGVRVAVEDVFAVAGQRIGAGHPACLAAAQVQPSHAAAVDRLLSDGADVRGLTRTSPLGWTRAGSGFHYGSPVNAVAPASHPGSPTATAVALGDADVGLIRATPASTLLPAIFQSLWSLRLTHHPPITRGMTELAAGFDSVGLLARTPQGLWRAAQALGDAREIAAADLHTLPVDVLPLDAGRGWMEAFDTVEAMQAWASVSQIPGIAPDDLVAMSRGTLARAKELAADEAFAAANVVAQARGELDTLLGSRAVLHVAWAGQSPPRQWTGTDELRVHEHDARSIGMIAALTGRPMLVVPARGGQPGSVIIGPHFSDLALIGWAQAAALAASA